MTTSAQALAVTIQATGRKTLDEFCDSTGANYVDLVTWAEDQIKFADDQIKFADDDEEKDDECGEYDE